MTRRVRALFLPAVLVALLAAAGDARAGPCSYVGGTVELEGTEDGGALFVTNGNEIAHVHYLGDSAQCGIATTSNTQLVRVRPMPGPDVSGLDLALEPPFRPGTPIEPRSSEIEFDIDLGPAPGSALRLFGGANVRYRLQLAGGHPPRINLNAGQDGADPDADMVLAGVDRVSLMLDPFGESGPLPGGPDRVTTGIASRNPLGPRFATKMAIRAGTGNDRIEGSTSHDFIEGGPGGDRLYPGPGRDKVAGRRGADLIRAGAGADQLDGLDNRNLPSYQRPDAADRLFGGRGADLVRGDAGSDHLSGGRGPDRLVGGLGKHDVCVGGRGRDRFSGCEVVVP